MPTPDLTTRRASIEDHPALQQMLELYQYDLSDIWDQDLDAQGQYGYALDRYWSDASCHAYVATVAGHYAGFALVDSAVKVQPTGYWMDQFFILKKYRRSGVGQALAAHAFADLPGSWEVGQMLANLSAQQFWRKTVATQTDGEFEEHELLGGGWEGYVQCFNNARLA